MSDAIYVPSKITDIAKLPFGLNNSLSLSIMTDSQRTAYNPALGEIVYTSDNHTFFTGDGSTTGGVAAGCGLSQAQLLRLGIIKPRHRNIAPALLKVRQTAATADIPGAIALGHSIVQGTGASATANRWVNQVGSLLQSYTGVGTATQWTAANYGVGGDTTANVLPYVAWNNDNTSRTPVINRVLSGAAQSNVVPSYALIMTLRNDVGSGYYNTNNADWLMIFRVVLSQLRRRNVDAVFVTEPPQINASTGAILDGTGNNTWNTLYPQYLQVADDEGASVVDANAYFLLMRNLGVDLTGLTSDGTHPNDAGHALIADMVYKCLTSPSLLPARPFDHPYPYRGVLDAVTSYTAASSNGSTGVDRVNTTSTYSSGAGSSHRKLNQNESTYQAFALSAGIRVVFCPPAGAVGLVVTYLQEPSTTATLTVKFLNSTAITTGGTSPTSSLSVTGGNTGTEKSQYFAIPDTTYPLSGSTTNNDCAPQNLQIYNSSASGTLYITGVTWICSTLTEVHATFPGATETGSWSASTITAANNWMMGYPSTASRVSSTVGDTLTVTWYGSDLSCLVTRDNTMGRFTAVTDGVSAGNTTLYSATATTYMDGYCLAKHLAEGWHTTVITVQTKDAASSANNVNIGGFRVQTSIDSTVRYVYVAVGETLQLPEYWRTAVVERVISGSPVMGNWQPGQSTLSVTGSGSALIRLQR